MELLPCDGCGRHVRADSPRCPFCDRAVVTDLVAAVEVPRGASRAALLALGATLTLGACRTPVRGGDDTSIVQPYGAPPRPPRDAPAAPAGAVRWYFGASATTLTMSERAQWRLQIGAVNPNEGPVDPARHQLSFTVNGQPSMAANLAFSNGVMAAAWTRLESGQSARDERALGAALFEAPGVYEVVMRHADREVGRARVTVTADAAQIAR